MAANYEYKVIPAPSKGQKSKGIKGPESRFANTLESSINELASEGWEFQRAETLPSDERAGLTGSHTVYRSVLVFRRSLTAETARVAPQRPVFVKAAPPSSPALEEIEENATEDAVSEAVNGPDGTASENQKPAAT